MVRLNDCQVEKTASGRRKLMYVPSENADLLANFRYDGVDLGLPGEMIVSLYILLPSAEF